MVRTRLVPAAGGVEPVDARREVAELLGHGQTYPGSFIRLGRMGLVALKGCWLATKGRTMSTHIARLLVLTRTTNVSFRFAGRRHISSSPE